FLLASRYCETDLMSDLAWSLFGDTPAGWARVQAIVDYAHERIQFGYPYARATRTAEQGHAEGVGVCRDYAHLAVTLCRAMNIPRATAMGTLGTLACRASTRRWISAPGSKSTSKAAGTPSTAATTSRASDAR